MIDKKFLAIPFRINIILALMLVIGVHFLLIAGSGNETLNMYFPIVCLMFGLVFIPIYSIIHEAEHNIAIPNKKLNYYLGVLLSTLFFASFTFIQKAHLNHHKNNRTDCELIDLYYDRKKKWRKFFGFFTVNIGLKWLGIVVSTFLFAFLPRKTLTKLIQNNKSLSLLISGTNSDNFFNQIRIESFIAICYHFCLITILDLNILPYVILYLFHGFVWSSQNYVSHAFSPRSILKGAHNHRMNPIVQLFYLNFNLHLAHHENPTIPWINLPKYIKEEGRISYLKAYIRLWKGPKLISGEDPIEYRELVE